MRMTAAWMWAAMAGTASAADVSLDWQARVLDPSGDPISTTSSVTISLYASGADVWRRTYAGVPLEGGYVSVTLAGPDDSNRPLDSALFASDLLVGIALDGAAELSPRMSIGSVPRAASVVGHVQPSATDADCTDALAGTLRWQEDALELCADEQWRTLFGAAPEILSVDVTSGAAGQAVTVSGSNFNPGSMAAFFAGVEIPLLSQTQTTATYLAPVTALNVAEDLTLRDTQTGQEATLEDAWTRTVSIQEFLVAGDADTWAVPLPGTSVDIWVIGGGGAGGRSYRTGGPDGSHGGGGGGGGFALIQDYIVPDGVPLATYTIGTGGPANNPNASGSSNQCLRNPSGDGVSTDGQGGGTTAIAFGTNLVVTATGGGGGLGAVEGDGGDGGAGGTATVTGPGASGLTFGTALGGAGSGVDSGDGSPGQTVSVGGVTYRGPGGGAAGAGNTTTPNNDGGSGQANSYTGGAGGGGADGPGAGGAGGTGFRNGGNGESASSNGGFDGLGGTFDGIVVPGGEGGETGIGRQVTGDPEVGRRNAGGGGGLFGAGGGGGGDSCSAGSGGGAQGVIVLEY